MVSVPLDCSYTNTRVTPIGSYRSTVRHWDCDGVMIVVEWGDGSRDRPMECSARPWCGFDSDTSKSADTELKPNEHLGIDYFKSCLKVICRFKTITKVYLYISDVTSCCFFDCSCLSLILTSAYLYCFKSTSRPSSGNCFVSGNKNDRCAIVSEEMIQDAHWLEADTISW